MAQLAEGSVWRVNTTSKALPNTDTPHTCPSKKKLMGSFAQSNVNSQPCGGMPGFAELLCWMKVSTSCLPAPTILTGEDVAQYKGS
jgi:hypothetical protein